MTHMTHTSSPFARRTLVRGRFPVRRTGLTSPPPESPFPMKPFLFLKSILGKNPPAGPDPLELSRRFSHPGPRPQVHVHVAHGHVLPSLPSLPPRPRGLRGEHPW